MDKRFVETLQRMYGLTYEDLWSDNHRHHRHAIQKEVVNAMVREGIDNAPVQNFPNLNPYSSYLVTIDGEQYVVTPPGSMTGEIGESELPWGCRVAGILLQARKTVRRMQ